MDHYRRLALALVIGVFQFKAARHDKIQLHRRYLMLAANRVGRHKVDFGPVKGCFAGFFKIVQLVCDHGVFELLLGALPKLGVTQVGVRLVVLQLARLVRRLEESVRLRLISEVPLGAFLSGGVDSSAVVAMMAGLSQTPVETCSIGFRDPAFNESAFARKVADRYHTNHYAETVESDDFDLIDTLAGLYDEPYADSSAIPTYRVCELARKKVTVALSGDGGDESFGGYRRYRLHVMEERIRSALPLSLRRPAFGLLGHAYPKLDWAPQMFRAKTTLQALGQGSGIAYERAGKWDSAQPDFLKALQLNPGFQKAA